LVCSQSRNSPHFTEPEGSLPHSQASATCLYPGPAQSSPSHLLEIRSNIIHTSTTRSPQWSLSPQFPNQDPIHTLSSAIRATCPGHYILLDLITRTILGEKYRSFSSSLCNLLHSPVWLRVQIMKIADDFHTAYNQKPETDCVLNRSNCGNRR